MKILLSNDDGYQDQGLVELYHQLRHEHEVTVVAPEQNRSGSSNSLTLDVPLRLTHVEEQFFFVNGTPSDCVHLGTYHVLKESPDIVVSGINWGGNLGDDVLYSGTVAAAMEGRQLGFPAIAVSLVGPECNHFSTAAKVTSHLLNHLSSWPLTKQHILNVNVPDVPFEKIKGYQLTRLGCRHRADTIIPSEDPKGRKVYWIGPTPGVQDESEGTDFYAVEQGFVSITPILVDLTAHNSFQFLGDWINTL